MSASPVMASPRQEEAPRTTYTPINGSIRVGFYQDTVSTKSSPDKSCSPRDQPHSPYQQYPEHVYTPTPPSTIQPTNYPYTPNPYYTQQPSGYAATTNTSTYTDKPSYYDTAKSLSDIQYNKTQQPLTTTTITYPEESIKSPVDETSSVETNDLRTRPEKQTTMFPVKKRLYNENENTRDETPDVAQPESSDNNFQSRQNVEMGLMTGRQLNLTTINQQPLSPNIQNSPIREVLTDSYARTDNQTSNNNNNNAYARPEPQRDLMESNNAYARPDINQRDALSALRPEMPQQLTQVPRNYPQKSTQEVFNIQNTDFSTFTRSEQNSEKRFDMNLGMGYLNTQDLTRTTQYNQINYARAKETSVPNPQPTSQTDLTMRYPDSRVMSHPIAYPTRSEAQNMTPISNEMLQMGQNQRSTNIPMSGANYNKTAASEMTIPRPPSFNASPIGMDQSLIRGNLANLSHIVDRFPTDERLLQSLPNSSYYSDKSLTHMFKGISTPNVTSNATLPMFSQPMPYREMQTTQNMTYSRPITELPNPQMIPQAKSPVSDSNNKKVRKRKKEVPVSTSAQGFQSYAGLKNTEPAISLKTASVVPGSAFNFGSTTGLGLPTWNPMEKDGYSGFLDEYRSPNYFLTQRSTSESSDKPVRQAHQQTTAPTSFPFLGHPQPRAPGYISPFMNPHQPPLMDPNSPLYQQYLHSAGVLHQGLLSPPTGYPPGYHPSLGMRQPYDSMTRPSWL